jgi:two-component system, LytTR family, response regulator
VLRVLIADDERPARKFLAGSLKGFPDVTVVGEAATGAEAVALIEQLKPDLALLDLNMPETGGLEVARLVQSDATPMIAFVTAYDEFAVQAFALNAIDYLLKPVEPARLAATIDRAAATALDVVTRRPHLERIPVRRRDETVLLPVRQIASIVAERELLHLTTFANERYTISYRLHALEARLDQRRFVRISRGAIVAVEAIQKFSPMPGGTYQVTLTNGESLDVSRIQSRVLRDSLLRL